MLYPEYFTAGGRRDELWEFLEKMENEEKELYEQP